MALPASHPDIMARFLKETSGRKTELFPEVDYIDVQARAETLRARGEPIILQLPLVPCYASGGPPHCVTAIQWSSFQTVVVRIVTACAWLSAFDGVTRLWVSRGRCFNHCALQRRPWLTIRKTQALSITHLVRGWA